MILAGVRSSYSYTYYCCCTTVVLLQYPGRISPLTRSTTPQPKGGGGMRYVDIRTYIFQNKLRLGQAQRQAQRRNSPPRAGWSCMAARVGFWSLAPPGALILLGTFVFQTHGSATAPLAPGASRCGTTAVVVGVVNWQAKTDLCGWCYSTGSLSFHQLLAVWQSQHR